MNAVSLHRPMVRRKARTIIACELAVNCAMAHDDATWQQLGADSLDMVNIPRALEDAFGIRFTDEQVEFCKTVGTAIDLVENKLENRGLVE